MEMNKETIKLSDKLHNLTLSHNRKKKALERLKAFFECTKFDIENRGFSRASLGDVEFALKLCNDALWSDGRVYYKPKKKITMRDVKRRTMKGGRQCAQD